MQNYMKHQPKKDYYIKTKNCEVLITPATSISGYIFC